MSNCRNNNNILKYEDCSNIAELSSKNTLTLQLSILSLLFVVNLILKNYI